jgi:succinate-semialdehyde dehydrogenase/glutarate-semialdehyde dehydrogenase
MGQMESRNPATEELLATYETLSDGEIEARLEAAVQGFRHQRQTPIDERAQLMARAADVLEQKRNHYADMITAEMGKPIVAARAEVDKCAWVCRYYAENGPAFMADRDQPSGASRSFVRPLPIGPVLAVMPWNFPFWQVFRFAAPALVAGNVGLLKHASNVPQSALAIEEVFREAGYADGVFQTLLIGSDKVAQVLEDDRVSAATLTGSEGAGRAVAKTAGGAIKKTVLELGGSDPFIVMPSADVDKALDAAVTGRTLNNGQSCIAAKRFLVHEDLYENFMEAFGERLASLAVGDPMDENVQIGPLAMRQIRDEVAEQVEQSVAAGARRVAGAEVLGGSGYFYQPGLIIDIPESAPAYAEEVFGPVALGFKISSLDEAIAIANDSRFGLGSAIFTNDEHEIERAATEIEAGGTFVNTIVASDPRLPFGGVKASGYGRELAQDGMMEFVNLKTVAVA